MYIAPDTTIKILKNCPLDNTYEHTIYFNTPTNQRNYFEDLTKFTLTNQTYQRVNRGIIRARVNADEMYDCNYLMFQNTGFGSKWFYAFITAVEYINNVTSEISYEIDVMQTWHFDYQLGQCFVDREHASQDGIGQNLVAENLETGPYITTNIVEVPLHLGIALLSTERDAENAYPWEHPQMLGGLPMACYVLRYDTLGDDALYDIQAIIDEFSAAGKIDAIVGIFTYPSNLASYTGVVRQQVINGPALELSTTVKNKKLYSYPYCSITLETLGTASEMRYELFSTDPPSFRIYGGFGANMQVACIPLNYAGKGENTDYSVTLSGFPVCPWIRDYFQNWLAQNKASIVVGTISGIVNSVVSGVANPTPMGIGGAVVSGLTGIAQQVAEVYKNSIIPDSMVGSANAGDVFSAAGISAFRMECRTIDVQYAKIIDDFFTMFGYKTNRVKVPNRNVRPHWTYTKTVSCVVTGSVPADDMRKICGIYDAGITFWKNGNEIGDYSLDNSP